MTDFQGELITHELQQGDGHFLQFLLRAGGLEDELARRSVMGTFKQVSNAFSGN